MGNSGKALLGLVLQQEEAKQETGGGVAFVGVQLGDVVDGGVSAGAAGVHQRAGVPVETLDGVGVVVGLRGRPGAGDGGGALGATVEALHTLRLWRGAAGGQSYTETLQTGFTQ